ncbi:probable (S)-N-methylcoclaurine 3'-hydroxylase isozyme 2 [Nymphaea colorata]|nr:probable (S)-N-methylcoclaurine 3'-hydroxylase isozyme 2 [Nymphaea colorata]
MEMEIWLSCCLLFLSLPLLFSVFLKRKDNLPPGPRGWPIVGNLFQLGSKPHAALASLARTYGPLFSLRLGTQRIIIASSASAAALVLKTHDLIISSRSAPQMCRFDEYLPYSMIWSDCNDSWKQFRATCRSLLFSNKMINGGASLRQQKVADMVGRLRSDEGKEVCISELVFGTIFGMMAASIFSNDAEGATGNTDKMKRVIRSVLELIFEPDVSDYFPAIGRLDVRGLRRKARGYCMEIYDVWEGIIVKRRKERMDGGAKVHQDFLDVLLSRELSDLQIKAHLLELFIGGIDATTATIEWAIAEFMKQPKIMAKLREELFDALSSRGTEDPDLEQKLKELPYFQACIKETMRLHPAVSLIPHCATETCEGLGYTIPKGCPVWVNVWAIGRDPASWVEPLTFLPERFIEFPNLDFKGADHQLIPFGSGRRICPGLPLAARFIELTLANLVYNFEWSLREGMDLSQLSMEEKFGVTIPMKQPLQIIPKFTRHISS